MSELNLLVSFLPSLLLCVLAYFFLNKSSQPSFMILVFSFLGGIIISIPAYLIEKNLITGNESNSFWEYVREAFIWVAMPEEFLKLVVFLIIVFAYKNVKYYTDYLLIGLFVSLGFATLENALYGTIYGYETTIIRTFTAIPAHAVFGIFLGYGYIIHRIRTTNFRLWVILVFTLFGLIFFHGLYDFFIVQELSDNLLVGALIMLGVYIVLSFWIIKQCRKYSKISSEPTTTISA